MGWDNAEDQALLTVTISSPARLMVAGAVMAAVLAGAGAVLMLGAPQHRDSAESLSNIEAIRLSQSLQDVMGSPAESAPDALVLASLTPATAPRLPNHAEALPAPGSSAASPYETPAVAPAPQPVLPRPRIETFSVALGQGDTLLNTLIRAGASRRDAYDAVNAMSPVLDPRRLRAGQDVNVMVLHTPQVLELGADAPAADPQAMITRLTGIRLRTDVDREVVVTRADDGAYLARELKHELTPRMARVRGRIESSLFAAAQELGVPMAVTADFARTLAYSVDFSREIQRGDSFEILYTQYLDPQGQPVKSGDIAFASLTTSGKTRDLFRHTPADDKIPDYFDRDGQSVKQFLMRTPVDAARISSRFGKRFHPIRKRWKAHNGVDFAAPRGTRIYAAGHGTVTFAGTQRGYGRIVKLRHANGYETRYAHMHRIAKGMRNGKRVAQGDVIGYVGATGWATGPHLHYEVRKSQKPMNPLSVKVPTGRRLTGKHLKAFKAAVADIESTRLATPLVSETLTASVQTR